MKKSFIEWVAYVFLFIWQIPQNIVGMVMWLYFKMMGDLRRLDATKWSTAWGSVKMSGGISLGMFCFLDRYSSNRKEAIAHELKGHTWDSRLMGPLYLLIVGLPSILNAAFDFTKCYYDFYPEKWANKHAGLIVVSHCRLKFKPAEIVETPVNIQAAIKQEEPAPKDELTEKINALAKKVGALKAQKEKATN